MMRTGLIAVCVLGLSAGEASAQSLFTRSLSEPVAPGNAEELRLSSMYLVRPPEPRQFKVHDIVNVIVNESSTARSQQSLETTKETTLEDTFGTIVDPMQLLQLRLRGVDTTNLDLIDLETSHEFEGEGSYDRNDQIIARIAAEIIDVKPNGNLVLQAKKTVSMDDEVKTLVLSGVARQEDVTGQNTLLSSQIADLRIDMQHEGEVRDSTKKGVITRVLETLFAF